MRFAEVGVATAANPTTENLRNMAHLGAIWGSQETEKKAELEADSERVGGHWTGAGVRGVHDGVDDPTSGSNAGVRSPNGSQVLRPVGHDGGQSSPSGFSLMSNRANLAQINSQTVVN